MLATTSAPVLADAYGSAHMGGWASGWMMGGWLVMVLVVILVVWALRSSPEPGDGGERLTPKQILAERFARGEISRDEYETRRAALRR